mmetsp:Transcript_27614/g.49242  ORF Transcript_27614/g.49242 Transcript_27614/m.49242 type:complete len:186 (-) Transcript_27614:537-1094(-)
MPPREASLGKSSSGVPGKPNSRLTLDSLATDASVPSTLTSRRISSLEIIPPVMNALSSEGPLFEISAVLTDGNASAHPKLSVHVCLDDDLFQGPDFRKLTWLCMVGDIQAQRSFKVSEGPVDAGFLQSLRNCAVTISPRATVLEILTELHLLDVFPHLVAYLEGTGMAKLEENDDNGAWRGGKCK